MEVLLKRAGTLEQRSVGLVGFLSKLLFIVFHTQRVKRAPITKTLLSVCLAVCHQAVSHEPLVKLVTKKKQNEFKDAPIQTYLCHFYRQTERQTISQYREGTVARLRRGVTS